MYKDWNRAETQFYQWKSTAGMNQLKRKRESGRVSVRGVISLESHFEKICQE